MHKEISENLKRFARNILTGFDMTESEWEIYHKAHPGAEKKNHHIIQEEQSSKSSPDKIKIHSQNKSRVRKYFIEQKKIHPNYIPIIPKANFDKVLAMGSFSIISAGKNSKNPNHLKLTDEEISKRTEALKSDLDKLGLKYTEGIGQYDGEEPSFIVFHDIDTAADLKKKTGPLLVHHKNDDKTIKIINDLGKKYEQDSVLHSHQGNATIVFTTGKNQGKSCGGHGYQKLDKDADNYYTEARVGKLNFTKWTSDISECFKKHLL